MASFYDFTLTKANGEQLNTADLKGKVVMVVNTATGCGFTPHYEPIENMYRNYHDKGLEIIDVPCNQFGHQTPGSDEEIHEFCTLHYNTTFEQMKKSDVNGANELPLYTYLKEQKGFEGFEEHELKAILENMFNAAAYAGGVIGYVAPDSGGDANTVAITLSTEKNTGAVILER